MKNLFLFQNRTLLKNTLLMRFLVIAIVFTLSTQLYTLQAQGPKLSIQGILKKANGDAVTDGSYNLTFNLYTVATAGTSLWTESQANVDVISGIYSTVLGNTTPLTISFNQIYYLGVTVGPVGSAEMTPRIQLTSAPYALSLIGNTNQFPSSGQVIADSAKVSWGVTARGGIPVNSGGRHQGFTFSGNNGDTDSGLGSSASGQVALYVNNTEKVKATVDSVVIKPDLRLAKGSKINYDGLDDWRLVETDYFENGNDFEGWLAYGPANGEIIGWNNGNGGVNPAMAGATNVFAGKYIKESAANQVLKKSFNLSNVGTYNYIKIKFKYYYLDTWDDGQDADRSFAAIAETATGTGMRVGYTVEGKTWWNYNGDFGNSDAFNTANQWGGTSAYPDYTENAEMTFSKCNSCNNIFWLMFGASLNGDSFPNPEESFGVGMIEIWVK